MTTEHAFELAITTGELPGGRGRLAPVERVLLRALVTQVVGDLGGASIDAIAAAAGLERVEAILALFSLVDRGVISVDVAVATSLQPLIDLTGEAERAERIARDGWS